MAFMAIILGLGPLFYSWGLGKGDDLRLRVQDLGWKVKGLGVRDLG